MPAVILPLGDAVTAIARHTGRRVEPAGGFNVMVDGIVKLPIDSPNATYTRIDRIVEHDSLSVRYDVLKGSSCGRNPLLDGWTVIAEIPIPPCTAVIYAAMIQNFKTEPALLRHARDVEGQLKPEYRGIGPALPWGEPDACWACGLDQPNTGLCDWCTELQEARHA